MNIQEIKDDLEKILSFNKKTNEDNGRKELAKGIGYAKMLVNEYFESILQEIDAKESEGK